MYTVQIMTDLNGAPLGLTTHQELDAKAAQEYASHWTYEMIKDGFIPDGATITYLIFSTPVFFNQIPEFVDVVSYLHVEGSHAPGPGVTNQ